MSMLAQLERNRANLGLSKPDMAARLGVSESTYRKVIAGTRLPGRRFLSGIVDQFPELAPQVWAFLLLRNGTIGSQTGQMASKASESSQDRAGATNRGKRTRARTSGPTAPKTGEAGNEA